MKPVATLALLAALPAAAEGRHDPVLSCSFGAEALTVLQDGAAFRLEIGGQSYPAGLARPGPEGRIVGVFAMLDAGPMMISVVTTDGERTHAADVTASATGRYGLATRTTRGTCTEATP